MLPAGTGGNLCEGPASPFAGKDIAGMRDKLVHQYFGVDLRIVWDTAQRDVPSLRAAVARILELPGERR